MNAPTAPAAMQTSELPLDMIVPANTHIQLMRRERFSAPLLKDLAKSISEIGVLQAIVVRPDPGSDSQRFELVAGERRWLAARIAGLTTIPATVRDLTDEQVLKAQLVENLQREGLHELEEAEGYDELMKLEKITAEQVAEMIGKSRSYVFARLKLLGLDMAGRKAFYNGDIDSSRALYVARISTPKLKERALKLAIEKRHNGEFFRSVRQLREELTGGQFSVDLSKAPFALADGSFYEDIKVKKGVFEQRPLPDCITCPNRTGNCLDLFNRDDDPDVCTEPACHAIKIKQHSERLRVAATAEGATIITGDAAKKIAPRKNELNGYVDLDSPCDDDSYPEPEPKSASFPEDDAGAAAFEKAMDEHESRSEAYKPRTFRQILEGKAIPTILIEDPKDKRIRTLVPIKEARAELKTLGIAIASWRYQARQHNSGFIHNTLSNEDLQAERAEKEARAEAELAYRREVLIAVFAKWSGPLKREDLVDIADDLIDGRRNEGLKRLYGGKVPEPGQLKEAELARLIVFARVSDCTEWAGNSPKPLLDLARRLKIDPDKIKKELKASAKEQPEKKGLKKAAAKKAKKS